MDGSLFLLLPDHTRGDIVLLNMLCKQGKHNQNISGFCKRIGFPRFMKSFFAETR